MTSITIACIVCDGKSDYTLSDGRLNCVDWIVQLTVGLVVQKSVSFVKRSVLTVQLLHWPLAGQLYGTSALVLPKIDFLTHNIYTWFLSDN